MMFTLTTDRDHVAERREVKLSIPGCAKSVHAHIMYILSPKSLSVVGKPSKDIRVWFIESNKVLTIFIYLPASEVESLHLSS
jgi:hypothetical protein